MTVSDKRRDAILAHAGRESTLGDGHFRAGGAVRRQARSAAWRCWWRATSARYARHRAAARHVAAAGQRIIDHAERAARGDIVLIAFRFARTGLRGQRCTRAGAPAASSRRWSGAASELPRGPTGTGWHDDDTLPAFAAHGRPNGWAGTSRAPAVRGCAHSAVRLASGMPARRLANTPAAIIAGYPINADLHLHSNVSTALAPAEGRYARRAASDRGPHRPRRTRAVWTGLRGETAPLAPGWVGWLGVEVRCPMPTKAYIVGLGRPADTALRL